MARSRNIKPGFFTNDLLAELPAVTRILFAGLWTIADREGRLEDRPRKIKAQILPYDNCDVDAALDELSQGRDPFIIRYEVDGLRCIQISSWHRHQKPHVNEQDSLLPAVSEASTTKVVPGNDQGESGSDDPNNQGKLVGVKGIRNQESGINEEGGPLDGVSDDAVREAAGDWLAYKAERRERYKPQALKSLVTRLNNLTGDYGPGVVCDAIQRAMANGWKGFDHDIGRGKGRGSPPHSQSRTDNAISSFLGRSDGEQDSDSNARQPALRLQGPSG